ncbi:MAG TPA: hypothetical protein VNF29_16280 [Candidatus Binataceae bacterium]|nr:hypothetical protein [Candidatus Binataceae bacterium]
MKILSPLPAEAQQFVDEFLVERGFTGYRELAALLSENYGIARSYGMLANYGRKVLRPRLVREGRLTARLAMLKRELSDQPRVLEGVIAKIVGDADRREVEGERKQNRKRRIAIGAASR